MVDYLADAYGDIAVRLRDLEGRSESAPVQYGIWFSGGGLTSPGWCRMPDSDGSWGVSRPGENTHLPWLFETAELARLEIANKRPGKWKAEDMSVKEYAA